MCDSGHTGACTPTTTSPRFCYTQSSTQVSSTCHHAQTCTRCHQALVTSRQVCALLVTWQPVCRLSVCLHAVACCCNAVARTHRACCTHACTTHAHRAGPSTIHQDHRECTASRCLVPDHPEDSPTEDQDQRHPGAGASLHTCPNRSDTQAHPKPLTTLQNRYMGH